jgi:DNA-binding transcriptional regulator YiaG
MANFLSGRIHDELAQGKAPADVAHALRIPVALVHQSTYARAMIDAATAALQAAEELLRQVDGRTPLDLMPRTKARGLRLVEERRHLGWTQVELARRLKLPRALVSAFEQGKGDWADAERVEGGFYTCKELDSNYIEYGKRTKPLPSSRPVPAKHLP